ncbi:MAG TPA: hypothetical protein VD902_02340 [Symbiobacteriaceae bacterium]|nr:hypothetical protein [Symbiobacteriaceae bacterium]
MNKHQMTGLVLITLGVMALLQVLQIYYFGLTLWTAAVVWLGLEIAGGSFWSRRVSGFGIVLGLWVSAMGLVEILANAGVQHSLTWRDVAFNWWPVLILGVGFELLFSRTRWNHPC